MKRFLTRWPYFPILYVINAVLSFYFSFFYETNFQEVLYILILTILITILCGYIFFISLHDLNKSAIIVFAGSVLFFSFQGIVSGFRIIPLLFRNYDLVRFWNSDSGQFIVFCFVLLLIALVIFLVVKLKKVNPKICLYLNLLSTIMIFFTIIRGFEHTSLSINQNKNDNNFINYWQNEIKQIDFSSVYLEVEKPDIYYIILDGFARSDTLLNLYDLDNSEFIHDLQNRGFYVATESYSNYSQTRASLASSLNMVYLDMVAKLIGEDKSYFYPSYYLIKNSFVEEMLHSLGYETVSFMSESSFSDFSDWDVYYDQGNIPSSFTQTFLNTTAVSIFINPQLYNWHRESIDYVLDSLPIVSNLEGSQFIFAHILCPHPPFVFNSDGSPKKADRLYVLGDMNEFLLSGTTSEYKKGYADQVKYIQKEIILTIDKIMNNSKGPFIIIIQADHGPGLQVQHSNLAETNATERFAILNAFYFYDQDYDQLYPQISPVNSFRVIFSQYLGIDLPLLKDEHYYSNYDKMFDFVSVDNLLK